MLMVEDIIPTMPSHYTIQEAGQNKCVRLYEKDYIVGMHPAVKVPSAIQRKSFLILAFLPMFRKNIQLNKSKMNWDRCKQNQYKVC